MKKEKQIKKLKERLPESHSADKMELEDAIRKLQLSLGEFRSCFEEVSLYRVSVVSDLIAVLDGDDCPLCAIGER